VAGEILITGGAGFIGTTLARQLVAAGQSPLVVDSLHPQVHKNAGRPERLPEQVELWPLDVTVPSGWDAVLKLVRPTTIVHLAAETGTGQSLSEATRHSSVNVVGTTQLLDALTRADHVPDHIILASSRAVYGEGAWEVDGEIYYPAGRSHEQLAAGQWDCMDRQGRIGAPRPAVAGETRTEPTNIYAATKLAQEHILRAWGAARGCGVSVLRFQNVFGVGQALDNPYTGVLSIFTAQALGGGTLDVYEDGNIFRDFVYVDDVASALSAAISAPPKGARTLDIGSGESTTILDVARKIAELAGAPAPTVSGAFRDGDVRAALCSISAARAEIGYTPTWTLARGLEALVEGAREVLGR